MSVVERVITVAHDGLEGLDPGAVQRSLDNLDDKPSGGGSPFRGVTVFQNGTAKFDDVILIKDNAGKVMLEFFKGAAEPSAAAGDAPGTIRLPAGDIINVRNVQGGVYVAGNPALLNLDLGAGAGDSSPGNHSADGKRGNIGLNYDVGAGLIVYDGRAPEGGSLIHQVAAFNMTTDNTNGSGLVQMWRPLVLRAKAGNAGDVMFNGGVQADTNPRVQALLNGTFSWGAGGTSALDTNLYRFSAGNLKTDTNFLVGGGLTVASTAGFSSYITVGGTIYPSADINWAGDTNLYRFAAGRLKTDTRMDVGGFFLCGSSGQFNGDLTVGGTTYSGAYVTTSDERLKTNVTALTDSLAKVNQLAPVTYEWREDSGVKVDGVNMGLIAQATQKVVPDAVKATPTDAMPDRLGIDYASLVPLLIGAVKELSAEVEALKAKVGG